MLFLATMSLQTLVQLFHRIRDFKAQQLRRLMQALVCSRELEDLAVIDALAFEHAARIMQAVIEHMHFRIAPGEDFAVVPDESVAIVKGQGCCIE